MRAIFLALEKGKTFERVPMLQEHGKLNDEERTLKNIINNDGYCVRAFFDNHDSINLSKVVMAYSEKIWNELMCLYSNTGFGRIINKTTVGDLFLIDLVRY